MAVISDGGNAAEPPIVNTLNQNALLTVQDQPEVIVTLADGNHTLVLVDGELVEED